MLNLKLIFRRDNISVRQSLELRTLPGNVFKNQLQSSSLWDLVYKRKDIHDRKDSCVDAL